LNYEMSIVIQSELVDFARLCHLIIIQVDLVDLWETGNN